MPVSVNMKNEKNNRNGRFRGNNRGRGRGRGNHNRGNENFGQMNHGNINRGTVFSRVGVQPSEGKTVLINPHFRGNVHVSSAG